MVHVGNEQILISVCVEVRRIHAHARTRPPTIAETDACLQRDLIPLPLAIRPGTAIHEQKILHRVVGDKEIHAAIVVDVGGHHSEALSQSGRNGCSLGDVGEGAVAVVVIEETGDWA